MFHSKIIRDFLQNEDGGIFSVIGTALGGLFGGGSGKVISTALGGALGGSYDSRRAAGKQNALDMQKFVRLRKAAEDGGFHPLEALRSGQSIPAGTGSRLFSSLSNSNAFDVLEDELTGEGAKQRNRESVEDEIRERELDKQRYDVAQQQKNESSITRTSPRLPSASGSLPANLGAPVIMTATDDNEPNPAVKPGRATVTPPRDLLSEVGSDPTRGDFAMTEERLGDNEIINAPLVAEQAINDMSYKASVAYTAEKLGMTNAEVEAAIRKNPRLRDELPGLIARTTMDANALYRYLKDKYDWPSLPSYTPPSTRLRPALNQSLYKQ